MKQMIVNRGSELFNLAEDIASRGLNPTEAPIVFFDGNDHYLVKDGNRRISAINALLKPKKIPIDDDNYKRRFIALNRKADLGSLRKIRCCVFDDEDEADHWVALKHTGFNGGVGTVKWDSLQTMRFKAQRDGALSPVLVAYNLLEKHADDDLKTLIGQKFPITNLERLLDDPEFRERMGFSISAGQLNYIKPEQTVIRNLLKISSDIASRAVRVEKILDHENIIKYADELETQGYLQRDIDLPAPILLPNDLPSPPDTEYPSPIPTIRVRRSKPGSERCTLIPNDTEIQINLPRANDVYLELKTLNINKYPNAGALAFRSLLEFSINEYIQNNHVNGVGNTTDLINKIKRVVDHIKNNQLMTASELVGIRTLCNDTGTHPIPLTTWLNACTHNPDFTPDPVSLKAYWKNIEKFIIKLWE